MHALRAVPILAGELDATCGSLRKALPMKQKPFVVSVGMPGAFFVAARTRTPHSIESLPSAPGDAHASHRPQATNR